MEPLRTRAQVVTWIFVAIMIASAAAALSDLLLVQYLRGLSSGVPADSARANQIDAGQSATGGLQLVAFVACAIAFLMWLYRAHANLSAGGRRDLKFTPRWAVGWFFVPFLNLVRPLQVMTEVWTGSAMLAGDAGAGATKSETPPRLVSAWWGLFLLTSLLGRASSRFTARAEDLQALLNGAWLTLASDLLDVPAAAVAVLLVRRITDFQERARTGPPTTAPVDRLLTTERPWEAIARRRDE